eukprot:16446812-Heterocapsa_arctica.AAC.1
MLESTTERYQADLQHRQHPREKEGTGLHATAFKGAKGILREGALRPQPWDQKYCDANGCRPEDGLYGVYGQAAEPYSEEVANESEHATRAIIYNDAFEFA